MTKAERRAQFQAMTPAETKAAYIQLCESNGYHRRDLGNGITVMVDQHYVTEFDAVDSNGVPTLYNRTTHLWHPSIRGAGQAIICVSA